MKKINEKLRVDEKANHYLLVGEHTFKTEKRVINKGVTLLKYLSNKFLNKKIKLTTELNNYRDLTQLGVDSKMNRAIVDCGFVKNKIWTLENPTIEDMLLVQYESRAYGEVCKQERYKETEERLKEGEKKELVDLIKDIKESTTKEKIFYLEENKYKIYKKISEKHEMLELCMSDLKETYLHV